MAVRDYFRPVETMTAEQVHHFLDKHNPAEYNLVDVRQPGEYQQEHLPGAQLISMVDLADRLSELDPEKPTITY